MSLIIRIGKMRQEEKEINDAILKEIPDEVKRKSLLDMLK